MAKIFIISPHFPTPDLYHDLSLDPRSKFLLNYATDWVLNGHEVTVVHPVLKFPKLLSILLEFLSLIFTQFSRFKKNPNSIKGNKYEYLGINILRVPVYKFLPHSKPSNLFIKKTAKTIMCKLGHNTADFDVVLIDYLSPSLDIVNYMKFSSRAKKHLIFHQTDESYLDRYSNHYYKLLGLCDGYIFRNKNSCEKILEKYNLGKKINYMYSGYPEEQQVGQVKCRVRQFLYVGRIIKSKNIQDIILAISKLPEKVKRDIVFEVVGDGDYKSELVVLVKSLDLSKIVIFTDAVPHIDVFKKMNSSDAFIMVSKETFGMVYIEALSQGNIVIAASNEGIDGVIENSVNGFLTQINNPIILTELIERLYFSTESEIESISINAINTSMKFKQSKLSNEFLTKIIYE
jgi:glycosyltransferase involved in cell wall biosynthesis